MIRSAKKTIAIQTFIWSNDETGRLLMYELIQAARRGVTVQIIADHFVSDKDSGIVAFLATVHPNFHLKHYRPAANRIDASKFQSALTSLVSFRSVNQRMHNKVMIFDDQAAITGGRNVENSYFTRSLGMNFKDRDVLVIGPVVSDVRKSFNDFWEYRHVRASRDLVDVAAVIKRGEFATYQDKEDFLLGGLFDEMEEKLLDARWLNERFVMQTFPADIVEFVADEPGKNNTLGYYGLGQITHRLKKEVSQAEEEIVIQSPYFIMSAKTRRFFKDLREKQPGLQVKVSTNSFGSTDNLAAYSANYKLRSYYIDELGFEVFEFKPHPKDIYSIFPSFDEFAGRAEKARVELDKNAPEKTFLCIHSKSFVVDGKVAFVGSYNFDPRSANLNTEVGFLVRDQRFASVVRGEILADTTPANSWVIARKEFPLALERINHLVEGLFQQSPVDLWPLRNSSSFELRDGRHPVPIGHPDFYQNYKDVGSFPGADNPMSTKEMTIRIYKSVGGAALPLL